MANNKVEKPDPLIGTKLGNYTVKSLIGQGGMARVYEGFDEKLERRAAIKVIEVRHSLDDEVTQRFMREARAAANLEHPNIVSVYEFGEFENLYYMAMRLIDGKTLLSILKRLRQQKKFLEPEHVVNIITQIGSALDYAHSKGVIHRDIKPSNIMLTEDDRAILTDFGLTMNVGSETTLGTAFGTPRYIAPEQAIASHKAVPQTDIYSLGVVLYEMVTGQTPFDSDSPMTLALSHITNPPPPPQTIRPSLPHPVQTVILKALEKRAINRWTTSTSMANALRDAYRGKEPEVKLSQEGLDLPKGDVISAPGKSAPTQAGTVNQSAKVASSKLPRKGSSLRTLMRLMSVVMIIVLITLGVVIVTNANVLTASSLSNLFATATPIPPRIRLIYSKDSFVVYNATDQTVSLEGISFVRVDQPNRPYDAAQFGTTTYKNLGAGQCIRIRMRSADEHGLPSSCTQQLKILIYDDPIIIFWAARNKEEPTTFQVVRKVDKTTTTVLQTCSMSVNTCEFSLS
ncbi:MAG: serine/threonine-protein kinase [Chloroflexota bacterium]